MTLRLDVYEMTLHVIEEEADSHPHCIGELRVLLDSDETAWVEPCARLEMTEAVVEHLADRLRPLGVRWMRGWHDGHWKGRIITAHGVRGAAGVGLINDGDPFALGDDSWDQCDSNGSGTDPAAGGNR